MSINSNTSNSELTGVLVGMGLVGVLILCVTIGRCTKESDIIGGCNTLHGFTGQRVIDQHVRTFKCEELK